MNTHERTVDRSKELWERAHSLIPSGTQTLSKGPTQYVQGVAPMFLQRGAGSHVWDVDGNEYIDYGIALGPVTLGYAHPEVDDAIIKQLEDGIVFSLMHPLEADLAARLVDLIPCAEMVKFAKNGSDVTTGAVRLARAHTGRDMIVCGGYHGWHDWYIGTTTLDKGIPEATKALSLTFAYDDIVSLERLFAEHPGQIAAVILEAIQILEPTPGFLESVNEVAHANGALVIYDEIVNGFRIALGGAQEYFGVTPDLAAFGKGMANGMPLSALVGRADVMRGLEEVFFSSTFGGETLSLAAASATLDVYLREDAIGHFSRQGRRLLDGYNEAARRHGIEDVTWADGLDAHSAIFFTDKTEHDPLILKSLFQQEVLKRGILTIGVQNICLALDDDDVAVTLDAYDESLAILASALDDGRVRERIEGEPIRPIFKRW